MMNADCLNRKLSVLLLYLYANEPVLLYTTTRLIKVSITTMPQMMRSPLVRFTRLPPTLLMLGVKNCRMFISFAIVFRFVLNVKC